MADTPQQEHPAVISHYRLEAEIGRGGMGSVFRATDQRDGSAVAIKLLNRELQDDPTFRERFEREAHVGALLRSPYTVHLIDYGSAEGHLYLVMDFVEGQSVREVLRDGPLPASRALRIATQVARALEEADARGVVHRDIKPDNIMLGPNDSARVLDFGIARQAGSLTLTAAGGFIGSLPYASPEHATGTVDHRSDLYSLGATLYHMLAGRPPFSGDALEMLEQHRRTPMPEGPLAGVPAAAVTVVARCLEKDPARRYQTATELSVALSHAARLVDDERSSPQDTAPTEAAAAPTAEQTLGAEATVAADTALAAETALATEAARAELAATEALSDGGPTLRLKSSSHARRMGLRTGAMHYTLTLSNPTGTPFEPRIAASDPDAMCEFDMPESVMVPAGEEKDLVVTVRPRQRRWRGPPVRREFTVSADGGSGPPLRVDPGFEEQPPRWPIAGGGTLALGIVVAVIAVVLAGGDGDDPTSVSDPPSDDQTPATQATEPSQEPLEVAGDEEPAVPDDTESDTPATDDPEEPAVEPPEPVPAPEPVSRIAFISRRSGSDNLYVMDGDGSNLIQLTDMASNARGPDWSPDGTILVFAADAGGDFNIWTIRADGSDLTQITANPAFDGRPMWSPDGSKIAFVSTRGGTGSGPGPPSHDIFVMNSDGTDLRRITSHPAVDFRPTWSADGQRLAFSSTRDGGLNIYILPASGEVDDSEALRLTFGDSLDGEPAWSPDGTQIAFESNRDGNTEIYVMDADGRDQRRLTTNPADDLEPSWSADSRQIIFSSARSGNGDLYAVDVESGRLEQLTSHPAFDGDPSWFVSRESALVASGYADALREIIESAAADFEPLILAVNSAPNFDAQAEAIEELWPDLIGIQSAALRDVEDLVPPSQFRVDHALFVEGFRDILSADLALITAATTRDPQQVAQANQLIAELVTTLEAGLSPEFLVLVDAFFN